MNAPNEDLRALRELPVPEPSAALVERVRRRAHGDLADLTRARGPVAWIVLAWTRVGLPVALVVAVVGYLAFAFESASALYR
jgi:hypothetical protein